MYDVEITIKRDKDGWYSVSKASGACDSVFRPLEGLLAIRSIVDQLGMDKGVCVREGKTQPTPELKFVHCDTCRYGKGVSVQAISNQCEKGLIQSILYIAMVCNSPRARTAGWIVDPVADRYCAQYEHRP